MSVGQHLSRELNSIHYPVGLLLFEVRHQVLGEVDVREHLGYLIDCVMTTLHFKFLQHLFLGFSGEE
jgi:hypothetical protein